MPNEPLAGLRILVVEDTASIRTLVIKLLERLGCADVFEAADSETAWHHLRRQTLDAVLLDYELQSDDGVSIAWQVRGDETLANKDVAIILLTSHDEIRIVDAARKADIDAYLVKPVMPDRLGKRILDAVNHRKGITNKPPRSTEVSWTD